MFASAENGEKTASFEMMTQNSSLRQSNHVISSVRGTYQGVISEPMLSQSLIQSSCIPESSGEDSASNKDSMCDYIESGHTGDSKNKSEESMD